MPLLQQSADFGFVAKHNPEPHRQHADPAMNRLQNRGMEHRRDSLVRCVDKSTCQLSRQTPTHVDGPGIPPGNARHVSTAADPQRIERHGDARLFSPVLILERLIRQSSGTAIPGLFECFAINAGLNRTPGWDKSGTAARARSPLTPGPCFPHPDTTFRTVSSQLACADEGNRKAALKTISSWRPVRSPGRLRMRQHCSALSAKHCSTLLNVCSTPARRRRRLSRWAFSRSSRPCPSAAARKVRLAGGPALPRAASRTDIAPDRA